MFTMQQFFGDANVALKVVAWLLIIFVVVAVFRHG